MNELTLSQEATAVVAQYKNIIREQDVKLQMMNEKLKSVDQEKDLLMVYFNFSVYGLIILYSVFYVFR